MISKFPPKSYIWEYFCEKLHLAYFPKTNGWKQIRRKNNDKHATILKIIDLAF